MNRQAKKTPGIIRPMSILGPRARWKAIAITSSDPVEFAKEYETNMNMLVSEGWNITGMLTRGEGVIITAQKPDLPPAILEALAAVTAKPEKPPRKAEAERIVYSYHELGECKSIDCATLEEATRYMEEHAAPWTTLEDGPAPDILPISIVVLSTTSYEPADLPLLRNTVK